MNTQRVDAREPELDLPGYSSFEKSVIHDLAKAGDEGRWIAEFMLDHHIHIAYGHTWYPNWFSAWWDARKHLVILDDVDFNPLNTARHMPYLLNIIAHELDHIRITWEYRGSVIPAGLTKYGELHGWKLGYAIQAAFTGRTPLVGTIIDQLLQLDLKSPHAIKQGSLIIYNHQKQVKNGWVYTFFYSLLPAYPWGYQPGKKIKAV